VRGPVSELKGRDLDIRFGGHSWFRGHAELTGLPDVPGTFMLVDVDELHTRYADLAALPVPPFKEKGRLLLPPEVRELGEIRFAGNFTGFLHAFTAYGISETALGTLRTDLSYQRPQGARDFQLNGRLATAHFLPGALIHVSALGPMAANIRISGSGRSLATMKATLEGDFPLITFNDTRITGVQASGNLEPNRFNGTLHATDEHLVLDFNGLADLTGPWPLVDFQAVVQHADLKAWALCTTRTTARSAWPSMRGAASRPTASRAGSHLRTSPTAMTAGIMPWAICSSPVAAAMAAMSSR
jgi:hypothetical protein